MRPEFAAYQNSERRARRCGLNGWDVTAIVLRAFSTLHTIGLVGLVVVLAVNRYPPQGNKSSVTGSANSTSSAGDRPSSIEGLVFICLPIVRKKEKKRIPDPPHTAKF
jgi:hypothetical protein